MAIVKVGLIERAHLTVLGVDPVTPQIPHSEQHRTVSEQSAAPAWLRDDPA
jgi:hypothetical protein